MRNRFKRLNYVLHVQGYLLETLGVVFLVPLVVAFVYWNGGGESHRTVLAFVIPSALSIAGGRMLRRMF